MIGLYKFSREETLNLSGQFNDDRLEYLIGKKRAPFIAWSPNSFGQALRLWFNSELDQNEYGKGILFELKKSDVELFIYDARKVKNKDMSPLDVLPIPSRVNTKRIYPDEYYIGLRDALTEFLAILNRTDFSSEIIIYCDDIHAFS